MAIDSAKIEALMTSLGAEMEIPEGFQELLEQCLLKAGFGETTPAPLAAPAPVPVQAVASKTGRRTGYNLFYTERNKALKDEGVNTGRQEQIVREWHALGKEGQEKWNAQARTQSGAPATKDTGTKALNGYNLFVKEMSPSLKDQFKGADLFREVGRLWKEANQEEWKAKAKALASH